MLFHEGFQDLSEWEPLTFPKISKHSTYTIVTENGHSISQGGKSQFGIGYYLSKNMERLRVSPSALEVEGG
jgi:hypothetical protein